MGFCDRLWAHLQVVRANRILTRWKEDPTAPRWTYGEQEWQARQPANDMPLSDQDVNQLTTVLKKAGRPFLYELFPEEDMVRIRRQEQHVRWAEEHWLVLAAYAWHQQQEYGLGHVYIIPRNLPLLLCTPDLVIGQRQVYYEEDGNLKDDPQQFAHLTFACEYPEAEWVFEESLRLALKPSPPAAYQQYPLPAAGEADAEPREPHAPPDYRFVETFFLEGLQAQGIVDQWRQTPWLPRRAYLLPGLDDDTEGFQPLSNDSISLYRHVAREWRWSRCRRNRTAKDTHLSVGSRRHG
jgi:hypothetical protein